MSTRVAINGLGRIGRAMLKLVIDEPSLELVAVNDLVDVEQLAYLVRFDSLRTSRGCRFTAASIGCAVMACVVDG